MFVLITYDVNITSAHGAKRLRNVARACLNYGKRVQNSVFECILTESQFFVLRDQLKGIIDTNLPEEFHTKRNYIQTGTVKNIGLTSPVSSFTK